MISIKQKQVLGVTTMVAVIVTALGLLHLVSLARVLFEESRARAELLANDVYHQAREVVSSRDTAYEEIRSSRSVQAALGAASYSEGVTDAAIVDPTGTIVAADDRGRLGQTPAPRARLATVIASSGIAQLRAVYALGQTLEWSQPIELEGRPFGEIRVGLSTILVQRDLNLALRPAAIAAVLSMLVAIVVAMLLAQIVLRPIHVIQSGLSRLGHGDLGATLDLHDEEFRNLGDVFDRLSAQLRAASPAGVPSARLTELSRRLVSLGRLTAGLTHEVKNPLNAMTIHLELLKQKLASGTPESAAVHADVIGQEIRRLDGVMQGFLKFVRPEKVLFSAVALGPLLSSVADAVQPEAERAGVTIKRDGASDLLAVDGDAALLREVFLNLAQNAVAAMPRGGVLTIACAPIAGRRVAVRVSDTGVGIAPEHLAKIFDLYFTTKEQGSGIGLSQVSRTIEYLHDGTIDVASVKGRGTTFTVTLPRGGPEVSGA